MTKKQKSDLRDFMIAYVHVQGGISSHDLVTQTSLLVPYADSSHVSGNLSWLDRIGSINYDKGWVS